MKYRVTGRISFDFDIEVELEEATPDIRSFRDEIYEMWDYRDLVRSGSTDFDIEELVWEETHD
jgi:hypothetical protein